MKSLSIFLLFTSLYCTVSGKEKTFQLISGKAPVIFCSDSEAQVVHTALQLFNRDCKQVLNTTPRLTNTLRDQPDIFIGTVPLNPVPGKIEGIDTLTGKHEAFLIKVVQYQGKPCLVIAGSDKRGTAYGILQLSRLLGVSPWEWWADVKPQPLKSFKLPARYTDLQQPSVAYRGIFINDEDWGLTPWSWQTYEPTDIKGQIGPKTHARIFELLLRLRANTFWPAMHTCSVPFYFTEGNKEIADKYGIVLGTSHCEPMMRNTNGEWKRDGKGEYDYVNNKDNVLKFWEQRVKETAGSDNFYTVGMRGVHDGKMQGAKTVSEQREALTNIIRDQRRMLERLTGKKAATIPQVFIPYKEVLDVYQAGLQVPDDITLMWCDDNYGYIRHFPTETERRRTGGNGIYYHISYWGRPHDYLWLGTTSPALVYMQMKQAYDHGIQKLWILNAGDIKPAEYLTELFLDMAWDIRTIEKEGVQSHLTKWLTREFGHKNATLLLPVMKEYYRLAYIHKPEFMGNTRTEEKNPRYKIISDLPWSEKEIRERLSAYQKIAGIVKVVAEDISPAKKDAYYQLIEYPVLAATEMNKKLLYAQLARHGKATWTDSQTAYDSILTLTRIYNAQNQGKWNRILDYKPRNLTVFAPVIPSESSTPLPEEVIPVITLNGMDYDGYIQKPAYAQGLGYHEKAVAIQKNNTLTYKLDKIPPGKIRIEIRLGPNHPVEGNHLRFALSLDNALEQVISYQTQGRSEEWKNNVLWNQAIRKVSLPLNPHTQNHRLSIKAVDEGVILDQILIYTE